MRRARRLSVAFVSSPFAHFPVAALCVWMTVGENEPSSLLLVISWVIAWHQLEGVGCPGGMPGKELPANTGDVRDVGLIPGSGRSSAGGHGNPLQYSCLENPTDRGAWWATVHGVTKSQTWLKRLSTHKQQVWPHVPERYPFNVVGQLFSLDKSSQRCQTIKMKHFHMKLVLLKQSRIAFLLVLVLLKFPTKWTVLF